MLPIDTSISFFAIATLLALSPGPDNIFVLVQSAMHGRKMGMMIVLGLCTGLIVHTIAVTVGLATLIATSVTAFTVLKAIGAIYLVYLAWLSLKSVPQEQTLETQKDRSKISNLQMYLRGIIMNVTNPKVTIFFLAFLPQFIKNDINLSVPTQTIQLGILFMLSTLLVFGAIAVFSGTIGMKIQQSVSIQKTINRLAAFIFIGLAIKLITSQHN